ncbi:hypothetical protein [Novosphingobium colocasiae]|uniref:hypothetical protein n=1 Tax=Novosphingobium colocasiae TaxID=1256513 RepID=UPI0035AEFE40
MVPDTDLQLQTALKALQDVIRPALDPANKAAHEQLGLTIASLAMVRSHLPLLNQRDRAELRVLITMADAVRATGALHGQLQLFDGFGALLDDPLVDMAALHQARAELSDRIAGVVALVEGGPLQETVARAVVDSSAASFRLARSWFQAAGFETGGGLPAIETLLAEAVYE